MKKFLAIAFMLLTSVGIIHANAAPLTIDVHVLNVEAIDQFRVNELIQADEKTAMETLLSAGATNGVFQARLIGEEGREQPVRILKSIDGKVRGHAGAFIGVHRKDGVHLAYRFQEIGSSAHKFSARGEAILQPRDALVTPFTDSDGVRSVLVISAKTN